MRRVMLLRHAKCDKSDNKYYFYSDEENKYDASDDERFYLLCALILTRTTWISRKPMT
jgi:hypothetical protein